MRLEEPVDNTHKESLDATYYIRGMFNIAKANAKRWVPKPYPKGGETDV